VRRTSTRSAKAAAPDTADAGTADAEAGGPDAGGAGAASRGGADGDAAAAKAAAGDTGRKTAAGKPAASRARKSSRKATAEAAAPSGEPATDTSAGSATAGSGSSAGGSASSVPFTAPFSQAGAIPKAAPPAKGAAGQAGAAGADSGAQGAPEPNAHRGQAAGVPAATFQPPQVIFQPPAAAQAAASAAPVAPAGGRNASQPSAKAAAAPAAASEAPAEQPDAEAESEGTGKRRRRRARSRGRAGEAEQGEAAEGDAAQPAGKEAPAKAGERDAEAEADANGEAAEGEEEGTAASKRRRRKRRRGSGADAEQAGPDDPPNTVVHVRPARSGGSDDSANEVQSVRGSTRLEAKRQRRREGRESGRRRPPVITESEFLARREAVDRVMVVRQRGDRTQIAVLEDSVLVEHYVDRGSHQSMVGNAYLGKVQNVLPSMEAAFVDIGKGRNAVLYAGEVNFDASGLEGESKRIESALKSGQSVLVQVTKDPVGHKGARLTSQVSLPGRYLVYVPGGSMMGISRKLPDNERSRLKQILRQVMPEDAGVIVRTAAEGASEEELAHDVARLSAQWESIERRSHTASPPELLYSEPDLTIRVVRDIFNEDFSKLVVSGDDGWDLVDEYVRYVAPHLIERLEHWQGERDAFAQYRIDEQISKALERKVWLPSGGSLVIDATEAMTVVDVNTGKFTGQGGNLEETVTRNNLEAAEEIVRQLRLRDVGGIIVIDFIDMVLESNRELVLRRLLECLARDRTKHQVAEVTSLGLVQMTRKRVGSGLLEAFSEPCDCCNGRGVIISLDSPEQAASGGGRGRGEGQGHGGGGRRSGRGSGKDGAKDTGAKESPAKGTGVKESAAKESAAKDTGTRDDGVKEPAATDNGARGRDAGDHDAADDTHAVEAAGHGHDAAPVGEASAPGEASASGEPPGDSRGWSGGNGSDTGGQPAEGGGAEQAPRGRRRRRAATREPGPPDSPPDNPTGDGQAPSAASAAAGV
jgi:ribonuclease E